MAHFAVNAAWTVLASFVLASKARFRTLDIRSYLNIAILGKNARKNMDFGKKLFFGDVSDFVRAFRRKTAM